MARENAINDDCRSSCDLTKSNGRRGEWGAWGKSFAAISSWPPRHQNAFLLCRLTWGAAHMLGAGEVTLLCKDEGGGLVITEEYTKVCPLAPTLPPEMHTQATHNLTRKLLA